MKIHDEDSVRYLTLDRPEARNAVTAEVARDLAEALEDPDPTLDAIVLAGEGEAFSAGGDIEAMAQREETAAEAHERVRETLGRVAEAVLTAPLPVVARIDGDAVGPGLSLVAAADFAYAGDSARFGASFVNVGLVPDMGATVTLPRIVGLRAAKELAFTGRLVDAREAEELDLVNETVPDDELDDRMGELLKTLAVRPTETIGLAKRAIHDNLGTGWHEGVEREASVQALAYDSAAHREGVDAFLNDRTLKFE